MPIRSLITGITGQDGSYLARELFSLGRIVRGTSRRPPPLLEQSSSIVIRQVDYESFDEIRATLDDFRPNEIYHLAGPSSLKVSNEWASEVANMGIVVTEFLLQWIADFSPATRFFFASSSEVFGDPLLSPQDEMTPASPTNPYGAAKLAGRELVSYFREQKGLFSCTGILYNHESPLRREEFVSRRISRGVARIATGKSDRLILGNLEAVRDWSHVLDVVRAFRLMLEAESPGDYVLASGITRSVRDFCEAAFSSVGLDYRDYVFTDSRFYRPDFTIPRRGNPEKAKAQLGWQQEIDFTRMVEEMVLNDVRSIEEQAAR